MGSSVLPLALLFIALTTPSIAQNAAATPETPAPAGALPADDGPPPTLVMFELGQRLEFDCVLPDPTVSAEYHWYKNGSLLRDLEAGGARGPALEQGGRVLALRRAHEDDFGNYSCAAGGGGGGGGGGGVARAWQAHARALARVPANTNVVEGQKFTITCKLVGKPYPRVAWTFAAREGDNATALSLAEAGGEGRVTSRASAQGVAGGVLEVRDAAAADAGVYACAPEGGVAAASTVRVKDVYAALWPFLGICLEVFILCAVILVYEKRRTKPELDDSDADAHDQ